MEARQPLAKADANQALLGSSTHLFRPGIIAGILAGALLLIADLWNLLDYLRYGDAQPFSSVATTTAYTIMSSMYLAGALLLLVALVDLFGRPLEATGVLGRASAVLALIGTALLVALVWSLVFIVPSAALEAPAFLDAETVAGPLDMGFMLSMVVFAAGWALVGVAAFRARVFPRIAAATLVVGALLTFAPFPASTIAFDIAIIWLSLLALRSRQHAPALEPGGIAHAS